MSNKPNNFPRQGQHNIITKDALSKLEADRAKPNQTLDYTIGGSREQYVRSNVEAERNYALNTGNRRFREVSTKLQTDYVFTANKGRAKAQFDASVRNEKTYAEQQRETIQNRSERQKLHAHSTEKIR